MSTTNSQKLYEEPYNQNNSQFQNTYNTNQSQMGTNYQNRQYQPGNTGKIPSQTTPNNLNYQTNYMQRDRTMSIKWRDIMKIDLKFIQRTNDLSTLETYLENLIYSNVTEDEISSVPEGNIAKLIRIYQFIIEYLLNSQQNLENNIKTLEEQNTSLSNEISMKDITLEENKKLIRTMKKEKKRDEMVLLTYKNVIESLGRKKHKEPSKDQNDSLISSGSTGKYFCKYCTGKKFSTEEKLQNHMNRRHLIQEIPEKKPKEVVQNMKVEQKLEEIKTQFDAYMKNNPTSNLMQYIESQKKIEEDLQGKKLEELEKGFKDGLKDLKDLYLQSVMNKQQIPIQPNYIIPQSQIQYQPQPQPEVIRQPVPNDNSEVNKILLGEISKMNQMLFNMKDENQKKFDQLKKEHDEEIRKLKEKRELDKKNYVNEPPMSPKQELKVQPQQSYILQDSHISNTIIKQKKGYFNAGPLESDHDDTDDEMNKEKQILEEMKKTTSIFQKKLMNSQNFEAKDEIELSLTSTLKDEKKPLIEAPKKEEPIKKEMIKKEEPKKEEPKANVLEQLEKEPMAKTFYKDNVEQEIPKDKLDSARFKTQPIKPLSLEDQLRMFYDKYHERDNKFLDEPKPEYYQVEIL